MPKRAPSLCFYWILSIAMSSNSPIFSSSVFNRCYLIQLIFHLTHFIFHLWKFWLGFFFCTFTSFLNMFMFSSTSLIIGNITAAVVLTFLLLNPFVISRFVSVDYFSPFHTGHYLLLFCISGSFWSDAGHLILWFWVVDFVKGVGLVLAGG